MTEIPTTHTAGDTFAARLDGATYPASAGWVADLILIGTARVVLTSTADGDDHVIAATGTQTAVWVPETYRVQALYSNGATRASAQVGALQVLPDPAAVGTDARAFMSSAQRALQDMEAAYRAHLASGNVVVGRYQIAGRTMEYRTLADLLLALRAARADVASEAAAQRISAGLSPRQTYVTRM